MPLSLNTFLLNGLISHKVDLLRFSESVRTKVVNVLTGLAQDLQDQIINADIPSSGRATTKWSRQEALIRQAADTVATAYNDADTVLANQLFDLADITEDFGVGILNKGLKATVATTSLTPTDLKSIASDVMIQGAPNADWWAKQSADLQHRFAQQVRMGIAGGETNDDIVRRIRGAPDGTRSVIQLPDGESRIVRNYAGGVMDISTRDATTLVRTAVQTVSNDVLDKTYKQNDDIVGGRLWVSTLDLRTSAICRALDRGCWDWKGDPLPDSPVQRKFPGNPPIHMNCRSVIAPITKSWEQLIADAGGDVPKGPIADIPPSVRASMDGQVPAGLTYEDWLRNQSVSRQKQVLGDGKWQLWDGGKLSFQEMVDQSGNPLTLEQLKAKIANDS